jgi:hypothetical protein
MPKIRLSELLYSWLFRLPHEAQPSIIRISAVAIFVPEKAGNEEKGQETIESIECSNLVKSQ